MTSPIICSCYVPISARKPIVQSRAIGRSRFSLLPEPAVVPLVADFGARVCGAHRFRGKPIWPDRLHITLLSAMDVYCGREENIDRAKRAGARVDAAAF